MKPKKVDQGEVTSRPSRRFAIECGDGSLTQQQFRESSNVNNIVKHYNQTGFDPYENRKQSQTFGYATGKDFSEAMQNVAEINSAFAELPSLERLAHANDPRQWVEYMETQGQGPEPIVDPAPSEAPDPVAPPEKGDKSDQMDII